MPLQALHLVQTSKSTITVTEAISSAIHVTDCHGCSVNAHAQQLRLHESTDLTCHVELVAGAIMEDCTRLLFVSDNLDDVKDFNWLRAGSKSPNYSIERPTTANEIMEAEARTSSSPPTSHEAVDNSAEKIKEQASVEGGQRVENPTQGVGDRTSETVMTDQNDRINKSQKVDDDDEEDDEL
jgi:hypothetical protein